MLAPNPPPPPPYPRTDRAIDAKKCPRALFRVDGENKNGKTKAKTNAKIKSRAGQASSTDNASNPKKSFGVCKELCH